MIKPAPPPKRGIAGMLLLFCVVAMVAGLGFEFLLDPPPPRFSVIVQPGGRTVLGIGVVAVLVLLAHAMRAVLAVREPGGGDASDRT